MIKFSSYKTVAAKCIIALISNKKQRNLMNDPYIQKVLIQSKIFFLKTDIEEYENDILILLNRQTKKSFNNNNHHHN